METNCRKLVSACVQLGKSPLLPPECLEGETAPSERGGEKAPAPLRGPQQLELSPGGLSKKEIRLVEPRPCPFGEVWGQVNPGELPDTPQGCPSGGTGTLTVAFTELPGNRRARHAVLPFSNGVFALCPSFSPVPCCPLTLALTRGAFPLPFGIPLPPHVGRAHSRPRRAAGGR